MRSRCILSKNFSIHGENREIYGPYNFWALVKSNASDVWNWNYWTFLAQKLKWWGHGPSGPPSGYAPDQEPLLDSSNIRWIVLAYLAYWVIVCGKAASFCRCHAVLNFWQCALPVQTNIALVYKALIHPLDLKKPESITRSQFR